MTFCIEAQTHVGCKSLRTRSKLIVRAELPHAALVEHTGLNGAVDCGKAGGHRQISVLLPRLKLVQGLVHLRVTVTKQHIQEVLQVDN